MGGGEDATWEDNDGGVDHHSDFVESPWQEERKK